MATQIQLRRRVPSHNLADPITGLAPGEPAWDLTGATPRLYVGYEDGSVHLANNDQLTVFESRRDFVTAIGNGLTVNVGTALTVGGVSYLYDGVYAEILDLPGWVPLGAATPQHFGSTGDIKERLGNRVYGWALSDYYSTLAEAQAVYPKATNLSETVDSHAMQRMIDAVRDLADYAGSGETGAFRVAGGPIFWFRFPALSQYVINRTVDITDIRPRLYDTVTFAGEGAYFFIQTTGEAGLDFLGTQQLRLRGFTLACEVLRGEGCPREGMLWGRTSTGDGAGGHVVTKDVIVKGRMTLAALHCYGSEVIDNAGIFQNDLDPLELEADYDTLTGTIVANETCTWAGGGTGKVLGVSTSASTVAIREDDSSATPLGDDVVVTTSGGATFTVRDVYYHPQGEDNGVSYGAVYTGKNVFGTNSQYATNAAIGDAVSFIDNRIRTGPRHAGYGSAMYIDNQSANWDLSGCYCVAKHPDLATVRVMFYGSGTWDGFDFSMFDTESDEGDTDPTTGQGYEYEFVSDTARAVTIRTMQFSIHRPKFGYAFFKAGTNINSVAMQGCHIEVGTGGRDSGQTLFDDASLYSFSGTIYAPSPVNSSFLNISDLAEFKGILHCDDAYAASVQREGSFLIMDEQRIGFMHNLRIIASGGALGDRLEVRNTSGTLLGHLRLDGTGAQLNVDGTNSYQIGSSALYYGGDTGTVDLGLDAKRFDSLFLETQVQVGGDKVLGPRGAMVPDLVVNYTSGSAPAVDGTVTIADSATPTVTELLAYITEVNSKLKTAIARMEAHGLIEPEV